MSDRSAVLQPPRTSCQRECDHRRQNFSALSTRLATARLEEFDVERSEGGQVIVSGRFGYQLDALNVGARRKAQRDVVEQFGRIEHLDMHLELGLVELSKITQRPDQPGRIACVAQATSIS